MKVTRLVAIVGVLFLAACHKKNTPLLSYESPVTLKESVAATHHASPTKLSRYGNPMSYRVKGHTYHVRNTTKDFQQQGIASWYGEPFHHERTSSGEIYDMYEMTAAHKTLPLPSVVKVRNLENGREVVVKVNDRGPFHDGRVIDLSYAAAKKLGMANQGTASVRVEAMPNQISETHWYLQAGAFGEINRAKNFAAKLGRYIHAPISLIRKSSRTLVHIGPLDRREQTQSIKESLNDHGVFDIFSFMR